MRFLFLIVLFHFTFVSGSSSTIIEDEAVELGQKNRKKYSLQRPKKALSPAENNIKGEYFELITYNPKFTPYVIAWFGHDVAYNFEFNRYAWIARTSKGWGVLMLHENNDGALMISLHGNASHCDAIEQALFKQLRTSRWSCTAVPDSSFAKELEASKFVLQNHIKADASGEKTYLRLSTEELEERQVISFNRRDKTVSGTAEELRLRTTMRRSTRSSLELDHRETLSQLDLLDKAQ